LADDGKKLRRSLQKLGLSDPAISAAWPGWWSDDAENSASARAELRFSLARKLGLDPRSLLDDQEPQFVWRDEGKFKRLSAESAAERAAISSYGASLARVLIDGAGAGYSIEGLTAKQLRDSILGTQRFVRLVDLLGLCWGLGVPVIHLRVFPLSAKRMCAMTARADSRYAILLGKDADYPAPIAYYLAHEIGHAALGHLRDNPTLVDLEDPLEGSRDADDEEVAADRYALELLTGTPEPAVESTARRFTARQLAESVVRTSDSVRIEPGTLALCFGHTTGQWPKTYAAMRRIYANKQPAWLEVNRVAARQLNWAEISSEMEPFLRAVMGGITDAGRG
jgi:hypothetical protein